MRWFTAGSSMLAATLVLTAFAAPTRVPPQAAPRASQLETATFAGGCFWSMERPFDNTPGVVSTVVGYAGGHVANPTYQEVGTRTTGHAESVQVQFDPSKVSYDTLLDIYWHNVDPITRDRQFCDQGSDYRTIIFYANGAQRAAAERSLAEVQKHFTQPVVTEIVPMGRFWKAEEYHQHFADRNPDRYNAYRRGCGRDARLHELWGAAAEPNVPPLPPS